MFDASRFLTTHFSDADGVIGLLHKHGRDAPPRQNIKRWFERNSLPGDWLAVLIVTLMLDDRYKRTPDLRPFITGGAPAPDIFG